MRRDAEASVLSEVLEQVRQVVGVLLLLRQDFFHQPARDRVVLSQVGDDLAVAVDGDALGDQILADHVLEVLALDVLGVAAARQALGREVGLAAELGDARRDQVGVLLLIVGMLQELGRHALGVDALGHEVVALVPQHADDLGGERLVEELDHHAAVGVVPGSDRAFGDVLPGPLAQRGDVGEERSGHLALLRPGAARAGALVLRARGLGAITLGLRVLHADVLFVSALLLALLLGDVVGGVGLDALDAGLGAGRVLGGLGVVLGLGDPLVGFRLGDADVFLVAGHGVALLLGGLVFRLDALFVGVVHLAIGLVRGARGAGEAERERGGEDGEFEFHGFLLFKAGAAGRRPAKRGTGRRRRRTAPWRFPRRRRRCR